MNDNTIITVTWTCPLSKLFTFRDRMEGYAEEMSAEQDGSEARIEVTINRAAARDIDLPEWAERIS